jgi:hypothetical protein
MYLDGPKVNWFLKVALPCLVIVWNSRTSYAILLLIIGSNSYFLSSYWNLTRIELSRENPLLFMTTSIRNYLHVGPHLLWNYDDKYSLRQELPCILCLVKVKIFKFWSNILVKLSIIIKPNTCNMKIYFMTILMMVISYYKY